MQSQVFRGALVASFVLAACGDDSSTSGSGGAGGDQPCGIQACDAGGSGGGDRGGGGGAQCGLEPVANAEFCAASAPELDCDGVDGDLAYELCGVALAEPGASGADASCLDPSGYPDGPGAQGTTRLEGHVRIFSNGCESSNVTVEVFTVQENGDLGAKIGTSATTPASCAETGEASASEDCASGDRYECSYLYPNVPTETLLAVKTSGPNWQSTIDHGVFITNDAAASGAFAYDPHAIATDDYGVIAQASMGHPVVSGHGAIFGEARDCTGSPVSGAVIGTDADPVVLSYFTNDEENPLPDLTATATGTSGLWAAMDVAPGGARVAAAAEVDGNVTTLGVRDVAVYPDTITWVSLQGLLPTQVPSE